MFEKKSTWTDVCMVLYWACFHILCVFWTCLFLQLELFLVDIFLCFIMFSFIQDLSFSCVRPFRFLNLNFLDSLYPNLLNSSVMYLISLFSNFSERVFVIMKLFICELMDFLPWTYQHLFCQIHTLSCQHF